MHLKTGVIAAFDFDGTLTTQDTLWPFICFCVGWPKAVLSAIRLLPSLLAYSMGSRTRQYVKEKMLKYCLKGFNSTELESLGKQFAIDRVHSYLKSKEIARLHWHQNQGHSCILVSANLEVFLRPWSTNMGFEACIGSRLAVDEHGLITGKLQGPNCWGPEKVIRLEQLLQGIQRSSYLLYAYGDSCGDRELLASADYPILV